MKTKMYLSTSGNSRAQEFFSWPKSDKRRACWVPFQNIICCISAPEPQGQSARFYIYRLATKDC